MKRKNLILRYFGTAFLVIGVALNVKMFVNDEWPTVIFFIVCLVGIIQIALSLILEPMKRGWQVIWSLTPFVLGLIYLKLL